MIKKFSKVYISMGANLGDPVASHRQALAYLRQEARLQHVKASRLYRTSPISSIAQPDYINSVCEFETDLQPHELFALTQAIEKRLGKKAKAKEAPRPFDIDILFYADLAMQSDTLEIPHPRWHERLFVLYPLCDLAPTVGVYNLQKRLIELTCTSSDRIDLLEETW